MKKPRLLWVGDAVVATGFERATRYTLEGLLPFWDIAVLGINAPGDPHHFPYPIFPARPGGDMFGVGRIKALVEAFKPEMIVIQQDPWNFVGYLDALEAADLHTMPIVGIVAVDGLNCYTEDLNRLAHCIFWTKFGEREAVVCGYEGTSTVIPLGVDRRIYKPQDRKEARGFLDAKNGVDLSKAFIVGNVNRNQPRKRLDLTVRYFAMWVERCKVDNAYLYLHVCPTGDTGYDVAQLMKYYGVRNRLILNQPDLGYGISEQMLSVTYNVFDTLITTTQGEGFGLTTLESMACGTPCIVPNWSALGDWTGDAAVKVRCTSTAATFDGIDVIGGVADEDEFIHSMDMLYYRPKVREHLSESGKSLAAEPQFDWRNIGLEVHKTLAGVLG